MARRTSYLSFQYDPLDIRGPKATRFVRVNPKTRDGLLDCEIWHDDCSVDFILLTHDQDASSSDQQILLNGRLRIIERTVWDFLATARVLFPQQAFWINAICIDHDNEKERARQVKLAPQFYCMATEVYIWLGPNEFYATHAIDVLNKEIWDSNLLVSDQSIDAVRFWVGLCEILLNSYWKRVETLQEFALPPKGIIMQGEHLLSMEKFKDKSDRISYDLSKSNAEIYKALQHTFRSMLRLSGISALCTIREYVQNCSKVDMPLPSCRPYSSEASSKIWKAVATKPNSYNTGNIKNRIFSMLAFTKHGNCFDVDLQLNAFELFLECIWLDHDSKDVGSRIDQLARILDMTPASILMYTKELGERFRIPGTEKTSEASVENRSLHELSSASKDDQQSWRDTGLAGPEPELGPYYTTTGLADLNWINGTGDSDIFTLPQKCQLQIVMRAGSENVFLLLGVYFSDDVIGSSIENSTNMLAAIRRQEMTDEEFQAQTIRCCCELGIYKTRSTPSEMTIYYAIVDGAVYQKDELELRALKYFNDKCSVNDRSSLIWTMPDTTSTTPLLSLPDVLTEESDYVSHAMDTSEDAQSKIDVKWKDSVELASHQSSVGKVAFSPDGCILASNSMDDTIRLWNTTTGLSMRILKGFRGNSKNLSFSADGELLAHELLNGEIQIWHLATEQTCRNLVGLSKWGQVTAIVFSPDRKLVASSNINQSKIRLWDLMTEDPPELLEHYGHFAAVTALSISPNGKLLASGSVDKSLIIWDLSNKKALGMMRGHTGTVVSVAFSANSNLVASASPDKTIRIWQVETRLTVHILRGHEDAVSSICFSQSSTLIVSGSDDGTLRVWDIETGQTRCKLTGHRNAVKSVAFSPNGRLIASGSEDSTIRLWGVKKNEGPTMLEQLDIRRKKLTREIFRLLRRAGNTGEFLGLETQSRKDIGRGKRTEDEGHELDQMSDATNRLMVEDLTHRRRYARAED